MVGLAAAILAPIAASMVRMAVSRKREFLADASGALLTRYPEGLARALEKIAHDSQPLRRANRATEHLYISNPLRHPKESKASIATFFSTHPPIFDRIARLRQML